MTDLLSLLNSFNENILGVYKPERLKFSKLDPEIKDSYRKIAENSLKNANCLSQEDGKKAYFKVTLGFDGLNILYCIDESAHDYIDEDSELSVVKMTKEEYCKVIDDLLEEGSVTIKATNFENHLHIYKYWRYDCDTDMDFHERRVIAEREFRIEYNDGRLNLSYAGQKAA